MSSPWLARPEASPAQRVRRVVHESWERARSIDLDPERLPTGMTAFTDDLDDYRLGHPLAGMMPVIRRLLVRDVEGSGLLVAVGDGMGRLLWVEGDRQAKRGAEEMRFIEGADWSERRVGTSAPGTALALDHGIQIHDSEHFNRFVHGWSCTAVPVHDPETRRILGVIDITGDARAVDPHTLPLLEATAAAVEAEMMVSRLRTLADRGGRPNPAVDRADARHSDRTSPRSPNRTVLFGGVPDRPKRVHPLSMHVLGRDTADLGGVLELSTRHSEILTVLAWHHEGLSAVRLASEVYGDESAVTRLRPEIVRLRHALDAAGIGVDVESRPYRLSSPLELDAHQVISLLDRGAHRVALSAASRGTVLPASDAPAIRDIRSQLRSRLREAILTDAAVDVLLEYAATEDGEADVAVWRAALQLLPRRSPKRASVVAHLESLEE